MRTARLSDHVADSVVCYQKPKFVLRKEAGVKKKERQVGGNLSEPRFGSGCWAGSHYLRSLPVACDLCETLELQVLCDPGWAAPHPPTHCFSRTWVSPAENGQRAPSEPPVLLQYK